MKYTLIENDSHIGGMGRREKKAYFQGVDEAVSYMTWMHKYGVRWRSTKYGWRSKRRDSHVHYYIVRQP